MESLDAGVLSGEEGLGVREFELPLSVDMLTASGVEVEGSMEPDLVGVEGIFAPLLDFFPAGKGGESLF